MRSAANPLRLDPSRRAARHCLLLCARSEGNKSSRPGAADPAAGLTPPLRQSVDWAYFLELGCHHGLLPLAYDRLRRQDTVVPPGVLAHLRHVYHANLRRNIRLEATLAEAVTALQGAGIEPIVLKGGALAGTLYPHPGLRPMVDLDLLIPGEAMDRAGSALAAAGYSLSGALPAAMVPFQQRFGGGLEWLREGHFGAARIDLQHDLVGVDFCRHAFAVDPNELRARARPLILGRRQALQLSAEDTLIHLCLHPAVQHGYASPLIGYVDIDRLVAREGADSFWQRLVVRAGQFRTRTAVYNGLRCAQDLLGTPVPAGILAGLAPGGLRGRALQRLAPLDEGRIWTRTEQVPSGLRQLLLYAALMERRQDVLGMVRAILFPCRDWLAARYNLDDEGQARLQGLVHPLRVARALVRGLHRPLVQSGLE